MLGRIDWSDENLKLWREFAVEKQTFYCETLGNRTWEKYEEDEELFLKLKIGFSLFGPPAVKEGENDDLTLYFDEPQQQKVINKILGLIKSQSKSDICIAFVFVIVCIDGKYSECPVIRVLVEEGKEDISHFIDGLGRVYKSWTEFLNNNVYPKCIYCYPKNGFYLWNQKGEVDLEFGRSPQSKILKRVFNKIDTVSTVAGLGSAVIGVASLAVPVAGPVLLGATATGITSGAWSACRTVASMVDKKKHSQSLSILDPEGRACWLSLAGGILGAASLGAIQYTQFIARNGKVLTKLSSVALNSLEVGNISVSGLGIINDIATMIQNKQINIINFSQLTISILFFCHCTVNFKTAKEVVVDIQNRIITNVENQLKSEEVIVFRSILNETRKSGLMEGNARVIKSLRSIKDKKSFFKDLLQVQKKADESGSSLAFGKDGFIRINDKVEINPRDFDRLSENSKQTLLKTSKTLLKDQNHYKKFIEDLKMISINEELSMTNEINQLCKHLKVNSLNEFEVCGKKIFTSAKPAEVFILYKTVDIIEKQQLNSNNLDKILKNVMKMTENVTCDDIIQFCLLIKTVLKTYQEYKSIYMELKKLYAEIQKNFSESHSGFTLPSEEGDLEYPVS